ncbi:MAG: hypothetical protein JWO05_1556 [Gemmatimonadetes bacterium]|nr:hypothetical protein [Gemmatimonadota bacterium]
MRSHWKRSALALMGFALAARCPGTDESPRVATYWRLLEMRKAVARYRADSTHLPDSIDALCRTSLNCSASAPGSPLEDAWGHRFRYQVAGDTDYVIRSAADDGQFGTSDDIAFSDRAEKRTVRTLGGCYDVDLSWWADFRSKQIRLDSKEVSIGAHTVSPTPDGYSSGIWSIRGDSIFVRWLRGDKVSVLVLSTQDKQRLSGSARAIGEKQRPVSLARASCAS